MKTAWSLICSARMSIAAAPYNAVVRCVLEPIQNPKLISINFGGGPPLDRDVWNFQERPFREL